MQTFTKRIFLFGVCAVAFYILALNSHIAALVFISGAVLTGFVLFALNVLIVRLSVRYYNRKRLRAMRGQMKGVRTTLDRFEPKRMPPGSMHEMHPDGDCGEWLERISESITALETRQESLDEAENLHDEIGKLHTELIQLWTRASQGMPLPKLE
jgi:hypothetical protein